MSKLSGWSSVRFWIFPFALLVFAARLAVAEQEPWRHTLGSVHPLAGRVWDVRNEVWVDRGLLARRLQRASYVLLGEKHDNADHHRLQAWLITSLSTAGRRPAVAFEMLDVDEQSIIDRQLESAPADARGLRAAVRWDDKGWPDWELYEPIFEVALKKRLSIVAANLSRATTQRLAARGAAAVSPNLVRDFALDRPLPSEMHRRLAAELQSSHCGHVSAGTVEKMILVQRTRDAQMARALTRGDAANGAVLIAGAFHVRNDYGVPAQLAKLGLNRGVVTVGFIEVRDGVIDPSGYTEAFATDSLPFDYVWFTPRVDDQDPCEKFADQLEQLRKQR